MVSTGVWAEEREVGLLARLTACLGLAGVCVCVVNKGSSNDLYQHGKKEQTTTNG